MQELGPNWNDTGRAGKTACPCMLPPALLLPPPQLSRPQSLALLEPPAASPAARSPCATQPGPAWVPQEGSRSADASIATGQDMRSAWIQQFQLISSPILQQFSEPVGCFRLCKSPFSRMVAPFPFPAPRRCWGIGSTPALVAAHPSPILTAPRRSPLPHAELPGRLLQDAALLVGAGAPASMGCRALQPQSWQSKASLAPSRAAKGHTLEHHPRRPDPLLQEGEQWGSSRSGGCCGHIPEGLGLLLPLQMCLSVCHRPALAS